MNDSGMNKAPRIMHVTGRLNFGGVEQLLYLTARHNDCSKYHLTFLAYESEQGVTADKLRDLGYQVTGLNKTQRLYDLRIVYALYKAIKRTQPDIIHLYHKTSVLGRLAAKLARVPVVICNDVDMNWETYGFVTGVFASVKRRMDFMADRVIASSKVVHDYWNKQGRSNYMIMHQPFDAESLLAKAAPDYVGPFRQGASPVIIVVSRFFHGKGLEFVLQAMPRVLERFPGLRLKMIGAGPMQGQLDALASSLELTDCIDFPGFSDDVFAELLTSDVYVLPSLTEGYSISTIEAMAAGLPVVATSVGIVPELVESGKSGIVIESGSSSAISDALLDLLEDAGQCREMGRVGRERVLSALSPAVYQKSLDDLYQELLTR